MSGLTTSAPSPSRSASDRPDDTPLSNTTVDDMSESALMTHRLVTQQLMTRQSPALAMIPEDSTRLQHENTLLDEALGTRVTCH